ncbi:putative urocanate hydratase [Desulfamplus magnetovallimortis]|uniref:Urocanate hydratase n=1 Tax=Desulfamplus magnetovallimortis TaxID=1246637 RepID=A0A1W1HBP7_9BACT|nr:urocanate hydratase [Desulfamplus magnetovallimortis]SLM29815.1 putative urocanate hydratase [Desulfamplus magnetovallimortis]
MNIINNFNSSDVAQSMKIRLDDELPEPKAFREGIRRAPDRGFRLTESQTRTALKNALRYIPEQHHAALIPEFLEELKTRGRIYGYRFRPNGAVKAKAIDEYKGNCQAGRAFQLMMDNNLDFDVALYPYELVTYGETGSVCQNWMQYCLIKKYLEVMTEYQTLVMQSGHPLGLFRSSPDNPRVIITNGLMVGLYDNPDDWEVAAQMGVSSYGQMTAGGWMYIGPQGIVHGTYNTLLNAGRKMCGVPEDGDLAGLLFVSSGLGGMSGAQPKAAMIAGAVSITAEVDLSRILTRHEQGWVDLVSSDLDEIVSLASKAIDEKAPTSIAYHGNIVDLLEYLIINGSKKGLKVDLLSDQTSCHVVYDGGYCPQGITFEERTRLLAEDRSTFKKLVDKSLRRHYELIQEISQQGTFFFDYGNAFLKAVFDAGVTEVVKNGVDAKDGFLFPSYFEDIMGPIFDYGYGPFRWVCLSGKPEDLKKTDEAAMSCINPDRRPEDRDNYIWIRDADANKLVVGSQARILYQDAGGRVAIALKFNDMVRNGEVGPIMLGRDHHDPGGTDSPFRETANIKDGSNVCADMATHCFAGNAARGMSLVALHNGGGTGIGKAINGGFGLVLDGSERVDEIIKSAMSWDVMGGVARRNWAGNPNAVEVAIAYNRNNENGDQVTIPFVADDKLVGRAVEDIFK